MPVSIDYLQQRKDLIVKRAKAIDGAGNILSKASRENRAMTSTEHEEWEKRMTDGDNLSKSIEALERQERANNLLRESTGKHLRGGREDGDPDAPARGGGDTQFDAPDRQAFRAFLKSGPNGVPANLRAEAEAAMQKAVTAGDTAELRAMSAGSPSAGGYLAPESFLTILDTAMTDQSGMLAACDFWDTESGSTAPCPTINDTTNVGERVSEGSGVTADVSPAVGSADIETFMYSSKIVKFSLQLAQDSAFNLEQTLNNLLAMRITRALEPDLTTGDGSGKPEGIITAAAAGPTIFPAATIGYSDLIDLEYSVDRAYRNPQNPKVGYMMHDTTLKILRKLTDDTDMPIFRAGTVPEGLATNREPDRLNGWPIFVNMAMATPAQGAKTVLFGAMNKYLVRRVRQLVMFRFGELYMANLQIGLLAFQRFGGVLRDAGTHPVKYLTQGAS